MDEHWVHYGPAPFKEEGKGKKAAMPRAETIKLAQKIQSLPSHRR